MIESNAAFEEVLSIARMLASHARMELHTVSYRPAEKGWTAYYGDGVGYSYLEMSGSITMDAALATIKQNYELTEDEPDET